MASSDDLGPAIYATSASFLVVTGLLVGLRVWIRSTTTGLRADDVFIIFSWVFNACFSSAAMAAAQAGLGRHAVDVSPEDYVRYLKLVSVCSATWSFGVGLAKCSFAVFYLRLIPNRSIQILNRCIIVYLLCQATEEVLVNVLQCQPVAKAWNPSIEGTCISLRPMWLASFVSNLCTDWILFLEPIPFIWGLHLISTAKKVGLSFMLSLGLLLCVISVKRIVEATKATTEDETYLLGEPMIWSMAELSALIICSCMPAMRQILYCFPWLNRALGFSSSPSSDRQKRYSKPSVSAASGFFFNRRVRYGRSTGRSGGVTDVGAGCASRSNVDIKSKPQGSSSTTTDSEGWHSPKRQHLMPPVLRSRSAARQPINLRSGIQSNLEVSSLRDVGSRATRSTDNVPLRPTPSKSCHDLACTQEARRQLCAEEMGMKIWSIKDQIYENRSNLTTLGNEKENYYPEQCLTELCLPAPAVLRDGRNIPPIKITSLIGGSEDSLSPGVDPMQRLKESAEQSSPT